MSGTVTVTTGQLAGPEVTAAALSALVAGVTAQVDEQAIGIVELADGSIPAAKLDPDIESQLGLNDGDVTTAKLGTACLSADGAGRLKMADGFVTEGKLANGAVVEAKIKDGAVTAAKLANSVVTANVQSVVVTNAFTLSLGAWRDVTGLSVTITPRSASSKLWLMAMVHGSSGDYNSFGLQFVVNGVAVGIGDAVGSRVRCGGVLAPSVSYSGSDYSGGTASMSFLHAHGVTTPVTVKVQAYHPLNTIYINKARNDADMAAYGRGISTLIVLEV